MSFGFSAGDFVLLVQLAHRVYANCQKAGEEYADISWEVKCFHDLLTTLQAVDERRRVRAFEQDATLQSQLHEAIGGCESILDSLETMLKKYKNIGTGAKVKAGCIPWSKLRFGTKSSDLPVIRGKLASYTHIITVILHTIQMQAIDTLNDKVQVGFEANARNAEQVNNTLDEGFEGMKEEIARIHRTLSAFVAEQAVKEQRGETTLSGVSTRNDAGDITWQEFRKVLIERGFESKNLEKYKHILQEYVLDSKQNDKRVDQGRSLTSSAEEPLSVKEMGRIASWADEQVDRRTAGETRKLKNTVELSPQSSEPTVRHRRTKLLAKHAAKAYIQHVDKKTKSEAVVEDEGIPQIEDETSSKKSSGRFVPKRLGARVSKAAHQVSVLDHRIQEVVRDRRSGNNLGLERRESLIEDNTLKETTTTSVDGMESTLQSLRGNIERLQLEDPSPT